MRRAMRHGHMLGAREPMMHKLVPALVAEMGEAYPELGRAQVAIEAAIEQEESPFPAHARPWPVAARRRALAELKPGAALPGDVAFKLYDTYGFPLDLTQDILRGRGLEVDVAGFEAAMDVQRDRAAPPASRRATGRRKKSGSRRARRPAPPSLPAMARNLRRGQLAAIAVGGALAQELSPGEG